MLIPTLIISLESLDDFSNFYWSDSSVAVNWIWNSKPWGQYISDWVNEIRMSTYSTYHCPAPLNSARVCSMVGRILGAYGPSCEEVLEQGNW